MPTTGDTGGLRVPPRRFWIGRVALFQAIERAAGLLGGRELYRRAYLSPGRFDVRRERIEVADLAPDLEGFSIAQLSDLHGGSFLGEGGLAHVVDEVNAREPDLVVLTGDLITRHWTEAVPLAADLGRLAARHGVFAVFGNHDYRGREEGRIEALFGEHGIRFLRNASHRIERGEGALALVGLEDLEEAKVIDLDGARRDVRPGDVEVVLCHNPAGAPGLARDGCALVLSGHTHGNQIDLPWIRRLGPPHPGDRVDHGATAALTSRGLGVVGVPVRIRARPEVVWATLTGGAAGG